MLDLTIFCKQLKEKRIAKGYTQNEMANLFGISRNYYSEIEGLKANLSIVLIQKISSVMPDIFLNSIVDNSDKVGENVYS